MLFYADLNDTLKESFPNLAADLTISLFTRFCFLSGEYLHRTHNAFNDSDTDAPIDFLATSLPPDFPIKYWAQL